MRMTLAEITTLASLAADMSRRALTDLDGKHTAVTQSVVRQQTTAGPKIRMAFLLLRRGEPPTDGHWTPVYEALDGVLGSGWELVDATREKLNDMAGERLVYEMVSLP